MRLATIGFSVLAWSLVAAPASAKVIRYEINGNHYAYDSSKPEEIAVARRLIDAANAADQAKAAAAAERARNPLASIFGSEAQEAALAAQTRLDKLIAEVSQAAHDATARSSSPSSRVERSPQNAEAELPARRERERSERSAKNSSDVGSTQTKSDVALKPPNQPAPKPAIQSVFVDPDTGIRTTFLADGSVREELVDVTARANEKRGEDRGRRGEGIAVESTGSTSQRGGGPAR